MENPNQIIVLGNGFDINCGLKSRYDDFIQFQMKEVSSFNSIEIKKLIDSFDVEEMFRKLKEGKQVDEKLTNIFATNLNLWTLLLFNRFDEEDKERKWQDIESAMYFYLKNNLLKNLGNTSETELKFCELTQEMQQAVVLVEGMALYEKVSVKSSADYTNFLMVKLYELEKMFNNYLFKTAGYHIATDDKPCSSYFDLSRAFLQKIATSDVDSEKDIKYNVLSFNYTNPWDKDRWKSTFSVSDENDKSGKNGKDKPFVPPKKYINVHGNAVRDHEKPSEDINRIIFGIDHKYIEASSEEYIFTKTYRTLVNYSDTSKSTKATDDNIFDKNVKIIKFFGHSLGEADYSYFQQMFDYYQLYDNDDLKLYFYFTPYGDRDILEHLRDQCKKVTHLLEEYGKTMTNEDHGKNLVTRLEMTKRLFIKKPAGLG